jgi:hypothetical protein
VVAKEFAPELLGNHDQARFTFLWREHTSQDIWDLFGKARNSLARRM